MAGMGSCCSYLKNKLIRAGIRQQTTAHGLQAVHGPQQAVLIPDF